MKRAKLVLDFIRLSILEKVAFYRNVIDKLKSNPLFTDPDVTLADATTSVDTLESDYMKARNGGIAETAAMHQAEDDADKIFRKLAAYVERIANEDDTIILQAGFNLSKDPSPRQQPVLSVADGDKPGSVSLRRKAVMGARSYSWQLATAILPTTEEGWTSAGVSTRVDYEIDSLTSGTRYFFRVAAVTPDGIAAFCEPVSRIVQ